MKTRRMENSFLSWKQETMLHNIVSLAKEFYLKGEKKVLTGPQMDISC